MTTIVDTTLRTDPLGVAHVAIPAPSDGLASTYGIVAASGPSTATANLVAPNARIALAVAPVQDAIDPSDPATIDVRGFDALDGAPAAGLSVRVSVSHGPTNQDQTVTLGPDGTARVSFAGVALGMNLVTAQADVERRQVRSTFRRSPWRRGRSPARTSSSRGDVKITIEPAAAKARRADRDQREPHRRRRRCARYDGERARRDAGRRPGAERIASTSMPVPETIGALAVGVVFVRDGALVDASLPLVIDGPGHQRLLALSADRPTYAPAATRADHHRGRRRPQRRDARGARERSPRCQRRVVRRHPGHTRIGRHDDAKSLLERSAVAYLGRAGQVDGRRHLRLRPAASNGRTRRRSRKPRCACSPGASTAATDRRSTCRCRTIPAATCSRSSR